MTPEREAKIRRRASERYYDHEESQIMVDLLKALDAERAKVKALRKYIAAEGLMVTQPIRLDRLCGYCGAERVKVAGEPEPHTTLHLRPRPCRTGRHRMTPEEADKLTALMRLCREEPEWAANRLFHERQELAAERAKVAKLEQAIEDDLYCNLRGETAERTCDRADQVRCRKLSLCRALDATDEEGAE